MLVTGIGGVRMDGSDLVLTLSVFCVTGIFVLILMVRP